MTFSPYHRVGNLLVALLLNTTFLHLEFYQAEAADTDIVINEIMYHPGDTNTGNEYIELYNRGATPVNLGGWVLEDAVTFTFPLGTILNPYAYLVVCIDEPNAISFYNIPDEITIGNYNGKLDNAGESIILKNDDAPRVIIDWVSYDDAAPWPTEPDGAGVSLELFSPNSDNSLVQSWGIGQLYSPGAANNPAAPDAGDIVITEIMYQPQKKRFMENLDPRHGGYWWEDGDDPQGEYIELFNRGSQTIDLAGWAFVDGILYTFPTNNPNKTIVNPGGYLVVCFDAVSIAENYGITNIIGNFTGSLANDGERVTLANAAGRVMDTVRYRDEPPWPIGPDQEGQSLECMDPWSNNDRSENWRGCRVPEPNVPELIWEPGTSEWIYYEATCAVSSNLLYFYLNGAGEWLVDDIRVYAASDPTTNIMENGSFEPDDSGWNKTGNHIGTYRTNTDFYDGSGCERIVSTGAGGSSTNSLNRTISDIIVGQTYKISCWLKYVSGATSLTFRLSGGGCFTVAQPSSAGGDLHPCQSSLVYFVGTEIFVTRGTPGAANTVSSTGLPPMAYNLAHLPIKPRSSEPVNITAQISSDETISSVMLDYEVFTAPYNTATESASIPMNDQGLNGDTFAYDGIYTAQIPAKSSQTLVRYRITAADGSARNWTWPDEAEPNPNKAYFVYDGEEETKLDACFMIMTQENLDWLQATVNMYKNDPWNPAFKQYARAAVVIDGIVYDHIKTRYRADRDVPKHAYKLKFNKYEYFNDMSTLDTDFQWPIAQDVASNMFTLVGQVNIALVPIRFYLNGDFAGILVLQESPNSAWLKKMGLDGDSEIYKSKSSSGCCSGFLPCGCIPGVCWCSIGSSCTSNLGYYSDLSYYPRMYIKRSDALGSFQSLQDFTRELQSADTAWLEAHTEVYNWIYKTVIHAMHGHLDYHAKNFYIVRSPDPEGKWDVFYFDYDMFWGCKMFGSCYGVTADPKGSGTVMQSRIYASSQYNNLFLLILKDVAENILTEEVVSDMLDQAFADTAADRMEELQTVNGAAVTTDARMADIKQHFIDRRNWLLNTYLPSQNITPPANQHPLISLNEPNISSTNEIQISWAWSDAEGNPSVVDLYWTDLGFNHFVPIPGAENLPAGVGGRGEFTWTTDIPDMTDHHIYIHAVIRDGNGVLVGRSTSGFAIPIEPPPIPGDINDDDIVDMDDLILFAAAWLEPPEPIDTGEMLTWDVAADYSLENNPNGAWSYRDSSSWLLTQAPDGINCGQNCVGPPGWEGVGGLPNFFHGPWNFAAADEMVSHGPLMIRWTSPLLGSIQISGSGKAPDWELSRLMHWQWRKNNVVLTEGNFPPNYSVVDFSTGTNGSGALVQSVLPGDTVDFVCTGSGPNPTDTFFSFKFQIEQLSGQITELAPPEIDFVPDNKINLLDFAVLAEHWMETTQ